MQQPLSKKGTLDDTTANAYMQMLANNVENINKEQVIEYLNNITSEALNIALVNESIQLSSRIMIAAWVYLLYDRSTFEAEFTETVIKLMRNINITIPENMIDSVSVDNEIKSSIAQLFFLYNKNGSNNFYLFFVDENHITTHRVDFMELIGQETFNEALQSDLFINYMQPDIDEVLAAYQQIAVNSNTLPIDEMLEANDKVRDNINPYQSRLFDTAKFLAAELSPKIVQSGGNPLKILWH